MPLRAGVERGGKKDDDYDDVGDDEPERVRV